MPKDAILASLSKQKRVITGTRGTYREALRTHGPQDLTIARMKKQRAREVERWARMLVHVPPFDKLRPEARRATADKLRLVSFAPGAVIMREGAENERECFIILEGEASVYVGGHGGGGDDDDDGSYLGELVCRLGARRYFGELALLTDEPRSATVIAGAAVPPAPGSDEAMAVAAGAEAPPFGLRCLVMRREEYRAALKQSEAAQADRLARARVTLAEVKPVSSFSRRHHLHAPLPQNAHRVTLLS